jgi:VWFA-related protein
MKILRLALAALICGVLSSAHHSRFALKIDAAVLSLDVEVTDPGGKPVTTLTKADFQLSQDGAPQEISYFAPTDAPYRILAMFDCTGSLSGQWEFLSDAVAGFVRGLRSQDSIRLVAFGLQPVTLRNWTLRNGLRLDFQMPRPGPGSICNGADFYGAIASAASTMRDVSTSRKSVVVFTDGVYDRIPRKTVRLGGLDLSRFVDAEDDQDFQSVLGAVRASGARFYFVAMNTDLNPGAVNENLHPVADYSPLPIYNMQQVRSRMELLAAESGGRIVFPHKAADYAPLYERIAREFGATYTLGYTPSAGDGRAYHRIEVRVNDPQLKTRQSRSGYGPINATEKLRQLSR